MTTHTEKIMERALLWIIGVSLTGLVTWASWSTALDIHQETRLSVVETKTDNIYKSLDRIEHKLDEIGKRKGDTQWDSTH